MALSDVLDTIGQGLKKTGQVAGAVLPVAGQVIGDVADPDAARQRDDRQNQMEDRAIEVQASQLQDQLRQGQRYGTLTPEQQQDLSTQIIGLYNKPRHAPMLMDRLRQIVHPNGAVAQGPMSEHLGLPAGVSATPTGGTYAYEQENKAQSNKPLAPDVVALNTYTQEKFGTPFNESTVDQQGEAFRKVGDKRRKASLVHTLVIDSDSPSGFSSTAWDMMNGEVVSTLPNVVPPRGFIPTHRITHTKDQYGNETSTVSTIEPQVPGKGKPTPGPGPAPASTINLAPHPDDVAAAEEAAAPKPAKKAAPKAAGVAGALTAAPTGAPAPAPAPTGTTPAAAAFTPPSKKPLDATGHIPETDGANPQVREFANQLLDDRDVDKIPAKARAAASALARQYGWEQGKFTPKEQLLLKESSTFLNDALADTSILKALDADTFSRAQLSQLVANPDKMGFIGRTLTSSLAQNMTPENARFVQWYNQAVGTISGLGQLVRSGRVTEATIERLKAELPNPVTTKNSADAVARLGRLNREIGIALEKGQFPASDPNSAPQPTGGYQVGQIVNMRDGSTRRITGPKGANGKYPSELVK